MNAEVVTLKIECPDPVVIARTVEVACGGSYVTLRQIMSRSDDEWTVYEGEGRDRGLVAKVANAPHAETSEHLLPWAVDLVTRRERKRLADAALRSQIDDRPHPVPDDDDQPPIDQG